MSRPLPTDYQFSAILFNGSKDKLDNVIKHYLNFNDDNLPWVFNRYTLVQANPDIAIQAGADIYSGEPLSILVEYQNYYRQYRNQGHPDPAIIIILQCEIKNFTKGIYKRLQEANVVITSDRQAKFDLLLNHEPGTFYPDWNLHSILELFRFYNPEIVGYDFSDDAKLYANEQAAWGYIPFTLDELEEHQFEPILNRIDDENLILGIYTYNGYPVIPVETITLATEVNARILTGNGTQVFDIECVEGRSYFAEKEPSLHDVSAYLESLDVLEDELDRFNWTMFDVEGMDTESYAVPAFGIE